MARDGRSHFACAVLLLALFHGLASAGDDRVAAALEVQVALQRGRTALLRGDYQLAVQVLESQISRDLEMQPQYLITLRDAYRGHIKALKLAGRDQEAALYARRLLILDPGSALDSAPGKAAPARPKEEEKKAAPLLARGKIDDAPRPAPDPFSMANHRRAAEASGYLAEAEKQFLAEKYARAGDLYARAHEAVPDAVKPAIDRWAYCKLFQVAGRLNATDKPVTPDELPALEQETRWAMSAAPKLEPFGKKVLAGIDSRRSAGTPAKPKQEEAPAGEIAVKHSRAPGAKWALAETANFRVFHNLEQAQAEQVARIAESTRSSMQKKWFGKVSEDWNPRCDLYVHENAEIYARESGAATNSPGHATISSQGERVISRRLDMRLDAPNMLTGVLPHETTHVVLAARFGPYLIPRWADEGMAVLTEPRELVERHLKNLPAHRSESQLFGVGQLMEMKDYPQPHLIGAFYAQSVSLVDYLSGLKGPQTFAAFLTDGLRGGYEAALRKHYGIEGYQALQTQWEAHAFRQSGLVRRGE